MSILDGTFRGVDQRVKAPLVCPTCNAVLARHPDGIRTHYRIKHKDILPEQRNAIIGALFPNVKFHYNATR